MTIENDRGIIYPGAWQALRYSMVNGWTTIAQEDEIFNMNFTVKDDCPGNWEITSISFNTSHSKEVLLKIGNKVWKYSRVCKNKRVRVIYRCQLKNNGFLVMALKLSLCYCS